MYSAGDESGLQAAGFRGMGVNYFDENFSSQVRVNNFQISGPSESSVGFGKRNPEKNLNISDASNVVCKEGCGGILNQHLNE